ncbi:phosphatidylglycerophosphatase A [Planctomycetota bacterium]
MVKILSSFFGIGYTPKMPGTAGAAAAVLLFLLFRYAGILSGSAFLFFTIILTVFAILVGNLAEAVFGRRDPQIFVLDEVCGMFVTFCYTDTYDLWPVLILGFILFRLLDIIKPLMVQSAERLPGGYGIVMDDIVAGLIANLILHAFFCIF